jgi:FixJ family two-component response regulator
MSWRTPGDVLTYEPFIAIVDDDESMQHALVALVRSCGYRAAGFGCAADFLGSQALDLADCVTSDVQMDAIDGYALTRLLAERRPGLPVILITARYNQRDHQVAADCGAMCLLHKPFDAAVLVSWIERALSC